jgi:hypothetical protein
MDPVSWAKAKGPAYVGLQVGATICVALLIAFTVMRINNGAYEPAINPAFIAAAGAILGTGAMKYDKSDNNSNSA